MVDCVIKEVNERVQRRGLRLIDQGKNDWRVNQLLYADDIELLGDSKEHLPIIERVLYCMREENWR